MRPSHALLAAPLLAAAIAGPGPARAEAPLEPGTVLEIGVVGMADYRYRVPVDGDGNVSVPLLPTIHASGMDLPALRARVKAELSRKAVRTRSPDGRESYAGINAEEVSVEVFEYRPLYVDGDVARPGQQPYRPGLTVRAAVAMAGGLDLLHTRVSNPYMESADLRSDHAAAWIEYARLQAQSATLQAALDGKPAPDVRALLRAPVKAEDLDRIAATETARARALEADFAKEGQFLSGAIEQSKVQITALTDQLRRSEEGVRQQTADYDRAKGLYDKSIVPVNRVSDEQRQLSFVSERLLAVTAQISQARLAQNEYARKLQALGDQRRVKLLADLQDANARLATVRARIGAIDEKMVYTGLAKAQVGKGSAPAPAYFLVRASGRVQASPDEPVRSGDVVEVALPSPVPPSN